MTFATVNPLVNKYAQTSADQLMDTIMMVTLSIQQRWDNVGAMMHDYREHGGASKYVWGNKKKTYQWLADNKDDLYDAAVKAGDDTAGLMMVFLRVPGLGLPKAGFACQLWNGSVGCIDVHNLRNYDITEKDLVVDKKAKPATIRGKVDRYISWCAKRRSEYLWNNWCRMVAAKYPHRWADYTHVSQVHIDYLMGNYELTKEIDG
jgi:hypothetical protein